MKYWNLDLDLMEAPELVTASAQAFGAWARIVAYCVRLENGGHLRSAATWQARQWAATCRLDLADVDAAREARLVAIHGEDLRVLFYPHNRQQAEQTRRAEGFAAGSVSTPAKAEAARSNGRLGGRPRIHFPETQETHENPRNNPRETQEKPTEKPTAARAPSENGPKTERKVSKDKGKVSGVGFPARHSFSPPTHRPDSLFSSAPASPDAKEEAEKDEAWIARLARDWPQIDIPAEIEAAKRKHPTGFDRLWFERKWLPHSKPRIASAPRFTAASFVKSPALPEPEGWRDEIEGTNFAPDGAFPARTWAELPPDVQKLVTERLHARPAAHA